MRCRGMGRSQGQPPEQQTRQTQGEDAASEVKGSVYRHWAALTLSHTQAGAHRSGRGWFHVWLPAAGVGRQR